MTMPNIPRHYGDELPLYVAGHVSPEERAAIERHLSECAACRNECDLWRSLPDALASTDSVPSAILATNEVWSKLAPRLYDTPTMNGRSPSMSFTSDIPPRPPRAIRPNTWAAVAIVLVVIVLLGGFFAVLKGRNTSPTVGAKPPTATATATFTPTPTHEPTATPTSAPAAGTVSGTWTGEAPSMPNARGSNYQDCYEVDLTQVQGSTSVTGKYEEFQSSCSSIPYGIPLAGSLQGSHLQLSMAPVAGGLLMAAQAMPLKPLNPASSCGALALSLTFHSPSSLTGTITDCGTVNITFTRH